MSESVPLYLKQRAARSFRELRKQTHGLSLEQATRFADARWPDQRWGIGQNGSIAGIVYHVAAWKQLSLPLFDLDGVAGRRADFDPTSAPDLDDWPGIVAWLEQVGTLWLARLEALPDNAFDEARQWEGMTITLETYVTEMLEHDIQHAAQIEYLRQRLRAEEIETAALSNTISR